MSTYKLLLLTIYCRCWQFYRSKLCQHTFVGKFVDTLSISWWIRSSKLVNNWCFYA